MKISHLGQGVYHVGYLGSVDGMRTYKSIDSFTYEMWKAFDKGKFKDTRFISCITNSAQPKEKGYLETLGFKGPENRSGLSFYWAWHDDIVPTINEIATSYLEKIAPLVKIRDKETEPIIGEFYEGKNNSRGTPLKVTKVSENGDVFIDNNHFFSFLDIHYFMKDYQRVIEF